MKPDLTTFEINEAQSPEDLDAEIARLVSKLPRGAEGAIVPPTEQEPATVATITRDKFDSANREVEFALLLAELINTAKQDPEQLRLTIYDFARTKLGKELSWASPSEREVILGSLEVAIRGVEKFSSRSDQIKLLPGPERGATAVLANTGPPTFLNESSELAGEAHHFINVEANSSRWRFFSPRRVAVASILLLFTFGGLLAGSMVVGSVFLMRDKIVQTIWPTFSEKVARQTVDAVPKIQSPPPRSEFPVPANYGVYVLDDGKLQELELLTEQVPDKRIAMSTPVTQSSRTNILNGRARFIVYRRDLANNAPERVDVRVVAQVVRALTFDSKGRPASAPVTGAWNIRNITYGFRVRPLPGNSEMLLIQPENVDFVLKPGRYVLVIKSQGYDFTVAGKVTDPSQCLERTEAANGIFYSECQKDMN